MVDKLHLPARFKAAGTHLGLSLLVCVFAAALVFGLWYPTPYREISGGQSLFILIVSVDLVLGPALTFVVFSPRKARRVLLRDVLVIAVLQLGGLTYGLHTVFQARPVALVYEPGRFRVVTNVDLRHGELGQALPEFQSLPLSGPWLLGVREPRDNNEMLQAIDMALQGVDLGQRPSFWQPYEDSRNNVIARARPLEILMSHYPDSASKVEKYLKEQGRQVSEVRFLPIIAKESTWSALVDAKTAELVGFIPYDGFI